MKTAHWDLPDQIFPMQDWQADAYAISRIEEVVSFTTTVCNFTKTFTAQGSGGGAMDAECAPDVSFGRRCQWGRFVPVP